MAYITQDMKKELAPGIKAVFKKYGLKGSISIQHNSTLRVTIKSGDVDFIGEANEIGKAIAERRGMPFNEIKGNYQANAYSHSNTFYEEGHLSTKCLDELRAAMRGAIWYDNSDSMTDYFDTAYFMYINIGNYDKPYQLNIEYALTA